MAAPKSIVAAAGRWSGQSRLNLPWLPEEQQVSESESTLVLAVDANATYATFDYTWIYEEKAQNGHGLIAGNDESGVVTCGWSDSWHQNGGVLALTGEGFESGPVKVQASYASDENGDWRWRIELELTGPDSLALRMTNIHPDDQEDWAVEAIYTRDSS